MKIIPRYITVQLLKISFFTLIALLGVYSIFDVINEVSKLNKGNYDLWMMLYYILLLLPGRIYELMPLAVLIGGMIAMTSLANHSEYTVIRTSGVSIYQIGWILLKFGMLFAVLAVLLGEFISPITLEKAHRVRLEAIERDVKPEHRSSIWVKDSNHYINIGRMTPDGTIYAIKVYQYDAKNELVQSMYADEGQYQSDARWLLKRVQISHIGQDKITAEYYPEYYWRSILQPKILDVLLVVPEQMSALNLSYYIGHLEKNQQQTRRYEIALWGKLFYPLACISMALIALAFTPHQNRQGSLGVRLFFGICLGVGFHFFDRFCGYLGLLYSWNPVLVSTLPTVLFLVIGLLVISWQERV